jgi:hypothetical protein
MQNSSHGKKPYQRPKCTQMSISEFALLVHRKTVGREIQLGSIGPSAMAEVPILIVEDYGGDLEFIRPAVRPPASESEPFSVMRDVGWLEMQFADVEGAAPQGTFLLLDLRYCHREQRRFLESIGHDRNLNEAVARVILARSSDTSLDWKGFDRKQCWQLRRCLTPEDLSTDLLSFLRLCSMLTNCTAEENSALEPAPRL